MTNNFKNFSKTQFVWLCLEVYLLNKQEPINQKWENMGLKTLKYFLWKIKWTQF